MADSIKLTIFGQPFEFPAEALVSLNETNWGVKLETRMVEQRDREGADDTGLVKIREERVVTSTMFFSPETSVATLIRETDWTPKVDYKGLLPSDWKQPTENIPHAPKEKPLFFPMSSLKAPK